jgi:hypothetical protein
MFKRIISIVGLLALMVLMTGVLTAAAPLPVTTFTLIQGLPSTMNVGDTYTVIVEVESDQEFLIAQALPSFQFVGKGVVAVRGGDHSGRDTFARLEITYQAKSSTAQFPDGVAPVYFVAGARYSGGYVASERFLFNVTVP